MITSNDMFFIIWFVVPALIFMGQAAYAEYKYRKKRRLLRARESEFESKY